MYSFNPYSLCACGAVWCSYARPCRLLKSRDQRVPLEVQPLEVPQLAKADREPGDLVGVEVQVPQLGHLTEVFGQFFKMAGLVTNSIRFCWLFAIKDWCEKSAGSLQPRFVSVVLDGVLDSLFWKQCTRQVEGIESAKKKPFQGLRRWRGSCWEERKRIVFSQ